MYGTAVVKQSEVMAQVKAAPADSVVQPLKVLAAEDNPVFRSLLSGMLSRWGYDTVVAGDGEEAWRILDSPNGPRLAILDWMMPGVDGVDLCRRLRAVGREPYVYVLLLTARTESEDLIEAMEAGADDYLTKPLKAHELRARLRAGRRILELQEQLLQTREALRQQATHDALTGLLNRASILDHLQCELGRARRDGRPVAVLMADLDRFKDINDTHGHLAGDAVLRDAAARMKSAIRCYDAIGRYGGEEFLIVLPGCDAASAAAQAERLRESLACSPFGGADVPLNITCSIGISWRSVPESDDPDVLVREADGALYQAKDHGRNQVVL
ncbi:MAG TPA: diguanylate cyclase [Bryobacteraceae bacterium]